MACVNMYNPAEHHQSFMAPRMSFSSDFALEPPPAAASLSARAPGDADFEFSVGSHPMMAADELFSKGRLLPLREAPHCGQGAGNRPPTLRDELRTDERHGRAPRAPNIRWKELLGFKKAPKKPAAAAAADADASSSEAQMDLGGQGGARDCSGRNGEATHKLIN